MSTFFCVKCISLSIYPSFICPSVRVCELSIYHKYMCYVCTVYCMVPRVYIYIYIYIINCINPTINKNWLDSTI